MDICQHCNALVPEHQTRCADCGTALDNLDWAETSFPAPDAASQPAPPVSAPAAAVPGTQAGDVSPLTELDEPINPEDFLRQLLGDEADAEPTQPSLPQPPGRVDYDDLERMLVARPKPTVAPPPISPSTRLPEHANFRPPNAQAAPPQPTTAREQPSFAKSGKAPTAVDDVYAVTARSNRLGMAATLGQADNHGRAIASTIAVAALVFGLGSLAGWATSDRDMSTASAPPDVAFVADDPAYQDPFPRSVMQSLVVVDDAFCDAVTATGFITSGVVLLPISGDLSGSEAAVTYANDTTGTGSPIGTVGDGQQLVLSPSANPPSSLDKGKIGRIADGTTLHVADASGLASGDRVSSIEVIVVSSHRTADGSYRTEFDRAKLPAGMPVLDESNTLVAIVDSSGDFATTLGPLGTEISSLKLSPVVVPTECAAEEVIAEADGS